VTTWQDAIETNRVLLRDILLGRTSNFINTDHLF
jgi:hypothetical protein